MKKILIFLLLVILGVVCSCKKETPAALPPAIVAGYQAAGAVLTGGTSTLGDLNAKSLHISTGNAGEFEETVLTFQFTSGSRMSGSEQEASSEGVPLYTVFAYDSPARLVVQFDNLAFWDYRHGLSLHSPLLLESFQYSLFESPKVTICFQLSAPVLFQAKTSGDTLSVHMTAREQAPEEEVKTYHYVVINAYDEYRNGAVSAEFDAFPCLARDLQNILLISPPMETQEQALSYLANAKRQYPAIPGECFLTRTLQGQELPDYDSTLDYLLAYQTPAVRLEDGALKTLPVLIPDGLYLCDLPGKEGVLYSRDLPAEEEGGFAYQQLVGMMYNGNTITLPMDFAAIELAQFSPDGRKLAVLENSDSGMHLYVFDADTFELLNDLSEMGFGSNTSTFLWNPLGTTIYAITGVSGMQLHQFDYSIPDEAKRHAYVDRDSVDEGSLGYCNGELYFALSSAEEGAMIYRIKPEGGVRKPFMQGDSFVISSDATYIAIVQTREISGSASTSNGLSLYSLATGETTVITEAFYPYECIWSWDCSKLYYIESRISGGQTEEDTSTEVDTSTGSNTAESDESAANVVPEDPYPYTLWVYDIATGESTRLLDLCAPDLFATMVENILLLNRYETDTGGTLIRTAYILDLNTVFSPDTPSQSEAPEEDVITFE